MFGSLNSSDYWVSKGGKPVTRQVISSLLLVSNGAWVSCPRMRGHAAIGWSIKLSRGRQKGVAAQFATLASSDLTRGGSVYVAFEPGERLNGPAWVTAINPCSEIGAQHRTHRIVVTRTMPSQRSGYLFSLSYQFSFRHRRVPTLGSFNE